MALIKLCLAFFIFCLSCGAVGSFFIFLFDVIKWHLQEKRTIISASAQKLPTMFERGEINGRNDNNSDSGSNGTSDGTSGNSDGSSDGNSGSSPDTGTNDEQRTTQSLFDSWLQPGSCSSE